MAFETELDIPTREELFTDFDVDYKGAFPEKDNTRGSDGWKLGRVISGVLWAVVAKVLFTVKNALADTADGPFLERWGVRIYKLDKKGPQGSSGALALRVSGAPASAVAVDTELAHQDGTLYKVTSVGQVIGGGGTVDVDVSAISTGSATNKFKDDKLTFTAPPAGVTAEALLILDLAGGRDNELDDEYRPRVLQRIGDPPQGGAIADYIGWLLKQAQVTSAFVYRHRRGLGTIDLIGLGSGTGSARIVTDTTPWQTFIEANRNGGQKDFKLLVPTTQTQDITVLLEIDEKTFKWDWNDAQVGYVITANSDVAKTITVPTAPAGARVIGSRLTVRGEEARVTNVVGDVFTLGFASPDGIAPAPPWFSFAITNAVDVIRASGDLVVPVRNALIKLFGRLGPAKGNYSANVWEDTLRLIDIFGAKRDVPGAVDLTISTPGANIKPVDPVVTDVDHMPYLVPGKIQVWKRA